MIRRVRLEVPAKERENKKTGFRGGRNEKMGGFSSSFSSCQMINFGGAKGLSPGVCVCASGSKRHMFGTCSGSTREMHKLKNNTLFLNKI